MKILLCGFNKNQNTRKFYLNQQLKVIPSHYSLFNCLVDMGHDVEQRQVVLGEDLDSFDEIIVFIAGPRQLVATSVYEGLYAIGRRPDCMLAVDDWQAADLFKAVAKMSSEQEMYADFILKTNKKTEASLKPWHCHFVDGVEQIGKMSNRMLVSAFQTGHLGSSEYGAHLIFDDAGYRRDRLFVYNPNPYHRNRSWEEPGHVSYEDPSWTGSPQPVAAPRAAKERRFNFASLLQKKTGSWLEAQGFTGTLKSDEEGSIGDWKVDLYGARTETNKRLTEDEMVKVLTRDWGCLMPGYAHAGSGWWRARPQQVADARSILLGDEEELRVYYGSDYPFYDVRAEDLAQASDVELAAIAGTQAAALATLHPLSKAVQQVELQIVLDAE